MKQNIYFRHSTFRKNQKEIIQDMYSVITQRKAIIVHAPTGIGKTDAAISASIGYALKNKKKILFLTPKTSQHKLVLKIIEDLNQKYGLDIKAIDFVGKRNLCVQPGFSEIKSGFYEVCKNAIKNKACNFYLNTKPQGKAEREITEQLIEKKVREIKVLGVQDSIDISKKFKNIYLLPKPLCPYEFSKMFAKNADVIVGDYNHLFFEKISKTFLAEIEVNLEECIVVVDEAHNLEARVSDLLSKSINSNTINRGIKEAKELNAKEIVLVLQDLLEKTETLAKNLFKDTPYEKEEFISKDKILNKEYAYNIKEIILEIGALGVKFIEEKQELRSSLLTIASFLESWFFEESKDVVKYIKSEKNIIHLYNNCLDVSEITKKVFQKAHSCILMSATLTPLEMYQEIYGLNKDCVLKEYESPFLKENRMDILINEVTTKYTNRNQEQYKKIAEIVTQVVNAIPGNTIVFFPSFEILRDVEKYIKLSKPKLFQEEQSTTKEFEEMIEKFKKSAGLLGSCMFAVMGGKASEGIDLPGELLKGIVIVGIPLSKMEIYTKAKIDYYEKKYRKGWQYAYIQPAIQKVIQSAGRVIRDEKDRGVIVYLDSRYEWENYRRHLPKNLVFKKTKEYKKKIHEFFSY